MSLASSNTFGATFYTDGFIKGTAYGSAVISCPYCGGYLWTEDLETIEMINESEYHRIKEKHRMAYSEGVNCQAVLDSGSYNSDEQEEYLRRWIWWRANDSYRSGESNAFTPTAEFQQNLERLQQLINNRLEKEFPLLLSDPGFYFAKIEILRELGKFSEAIALADACVNYIEENIKDRVDLYKEMSKELHEYDKRAIENYKLTIADIDKLKGLAAEGTSIVRMR